MEKQVNGSITSVKRQWWLKVNTKAVRRFSGDGAIYPYIITVSYCADGTLYEKEKWLSARQNAPSIGGSVTVTYDSENPTKAEIQCP